ncbi:MAG: hypothetical protein R3C05_14365 [Pirellulaceae bacterium]
MNAVTQMVNASGAEGFDTIAIFTVAGSTSRFWKNTPPVGSKGNGRTDLMYGLDLFRRQTIGSSDSNRCGLMVKESGDWASAIMIVRSDTIATSEIDSGS